MLKKVSWLMVLALVSWSAGCGDSNNGGGNVTGDPIDQAQYGTAMNVASTAQSEVWTAVSQEMAKADTSWGGDVTSPNGGTASVDADISTSGGYKLTASFNGWVTATGYTVNGSLVIEVSGYTSGTPSWSYKGKISISGNGVNGTADFDLSGSGASVSGTINGQSFSTGG